VASAAGFHEGGGPTAPDPVGFIKASYDAGITDEFLKPTRILAEGRPSPRIQAGDSVVFFNFRPDRARQLSHAIVDRDWPHFRRDRPPTLAHFVTFTEYEKGLPAEVAFADEPLEACLAEVIAEHGGTQFHTAETEKYAHVTYFLNGGREAPYPGEDRLLVPSPKVATYDLQPEMSAPELTDKVVLAIQSGRFDVVVIGAGRSAGANRQIRSDSGSSRAICSDGFELSGHNAPACAATARRA